MSTKTTNLGLDKPQMSDTLGTTIPQLANNFDVIDSNISSNATQLAQIATQFASSPPTTGTWKLADKVWNTSPASGGIIGWVCVQAGTFGSGTIPVFKEFGIISN